MLKILRRVLLWRLENGFIICQVQEISAIDMKISYIIEGEIVWAIAVDSIATSLTKSLRSVLLRTQKTRAGDIITTGHETLSSDFQLQFEWAVVSV